MKKNVEDHVLEAMRKDLGNWHGPFYVNRKDPRLLVPKYNEMMGQTINFGNPSAWAVLIGLVLIIAVISL